MYPAGEGEVERQSAKVLRTREKESKAGEQGREDQGSRTARRDLSVWKLMRISIRRDMLLLLGGIVLFLQRNGTWEERREREG